MGGRRRSAGNEPTKVVYINTQYVETDATSFKSVVQDLTGRHAVISSPPPFSSPVKKEEVFYNRPPAATMDIVGGGGGGNLERRNSFLMRDFSFKELDKMLKDLPSLDELHTLFAD